MEVAGENLERGRYRFALFLAHLALEKILKAHVTRVSQDIPPRIHDLVTLAKKAQIEIGTVQNDVLETMNAYITAGRYPDEDQGVITREKAITDFAAPKELRQWLTKRL